MLAYYGTGNRLLAHESARPVTVCSNTRKTCIGTVNVQYTPMCTGEQGHRERGGRGYNDPRAHEAAHGSKGAHQMTFRNEHVRPSFWRSPDFE